ncbi:hypothetical protein CF65_01278 [Aggregatibacter actinomycetemcomitans HK1651]|nr:hypothetical protein CF65_01278 [Aggregatibacter actinomycetemcomitans HK1651]
MRDLKRRHIALQNKQGNIHSRFIIKERPCLLLPFFSPFSCLFMPN